MSRNVYRYAFDSSVHFPAVVATLDLAILAIESLRGESRARLDARFTADSDRRAIVLDATTEVGQELNQVFVGLARREFGEKAFAVTRADSPPPERERRHKP